jgi:hypothetical protein
VAGDAALKAPRLLRSPVAALLQLCCSSVAALLQLSRASALRRSRRAGAYVCELQQSCNRVLQLCCSSEHMHVSCIYVCMCAHLLYIYIYIHIYHTYIFVHIYTGGLRDVGGAECVCVCVAGAECVCVLQVWRRARALRCCGALHHFEANRRHAT